MIDWTNIHCIQCGEKRKNTNKNKIWFDNALTDKKKGKMVFYCTNHNPRFYFVVKFYTVDDDASAVRTYVMRDRLPIEK